MKKLVFLLILMLIIFAGNLAGTNNTPYACSATLTSGAGSNNQTICINTAMTNITWSTSGVTGIDPPPPAQDLPNGVTASYSSDVLTLSGTPTGIGTFAYTITLEGSGGCSVSGTIVVNPLPQGSLTANGPKCNGETGKLKWTATAGTGPYTVVYKENSGTNRTATGVVSGTFFDAYTNPLTTTTIYTVQSVTDEATSCVRSSSFTDNSATITVYSNPSASITPASPAATCGGGTVTNLDGDPTGGSTPYASHLWTGTGSDNLTSKTTDKPDYTAPYISSQITYGLTYTVTDDNGCTGTSSISSWITVNPTSAITPMTSEICSGLSFSVTPVDVTNGVVPPSTTYTWGAPVLSPLASITGGSAQAVAQTSIGQTLTNTTLSVATATYTVHPLTGSCTGADFTVTVTVNPAVAAAINPAAPAAICGGGTISLNGTPTGGTAPLSHVWTGDGIGYLDATNIVNPTFTAPKLTSAAGYGLTYTVTDNKGCTATNSISVSVNPTAAITPMTSEICSGLSFSVTPVDVTNGVVPPSTTYTWDTPVLNPLASITGGSAQAVAQTSIGQTLTNTTLSVATATYTVHPLTGSCTGADFTVTVTVDPKPSITAMTSEICSGLGFSVTPVDVTNGVVPPSTTYTWDTPVLNPLASITGGSAEASAQTSIGQTLTNTTLSVATATYTVHPLTGSCTGADFTVTVTVNPAVAAAINPAAPAAICGGGTISLNGTPTGGTAPLSHVWTGDGIGYLDATNIVNPTFTAPKLTSAAGYGLTYTVTDNKGCTATNSISVSVNPTAAITPMTSEICSGLSFSVTPVDVTNGVVPPSTTYTWDTPVLNPLASITGGSAQAVAQTSIGQTLTNTTLSVATATYTVHPLTGSCTGADFTVTVTVNPAVAAAINPAAPAAICGGGTISLNGTPTGGTAPLSHVWTGDGIGYLDATNIVNPTFTAPKLTSAAGYGLTYTVTDNKGCTATNSISVSVNPTAAITPMTSEICSGLSFSVTPVDVTNGVVPPSTTYTWDTPVLNPLASITGGSAQAVAQTSIGQTLTNTTLSVATATYTVHPLTGSCTGADFTVTVTVNPAVAAAINPAAPAAICGGGTISLNGTPTGGTAPLSHVWTGDGIGYLDATNIVNPTFTAPKLTSAAGYGLTYTVTDNKGCTATNSISVSVNPTAAITPMTSEICSGLSFSVTPVDVTNGVVPPSTTYTWDTPVLNPLASITGGSAEASAQLSIGQTLTNTTASVATATYTVHPLTGSCTGADFTVTVTVNPKPAITDIPTTTCSSVGFSVSPTNGANGTVPLGTTYTWDSPVITPGGAITGGSAVGSAQTVIGQVLVNTTSLLATAKYTVHSLAGSCTGNDFFVTVTVNPEPVGSNDVASICSKGTLNYDLQGNINGHNLVTSVFKYTVTSSDPTNVPAASDRTVASSSNITDSYINTTGSAVLITYTVTPFSSSNNCQGSDFTYKVTVNPEPVGSNDVASICSKGTLNYDLQGNINGHNLVTSVFKYTVTSSDPTNVPAASDRTVASSSNITDSYINTTGSAVLITYTVTPFSSSNNCQGSDFTYKVTVNPEPVGSNDVASICSKGTLNYDLQGNINGHNLVTSVFKYTVTSSDPTNVPAASDRTVASSSNITDSYINTTGSAVLITYTVTPFSSSNNCQGSDFTYKVTVNPEPVGSNDVASICSKGTLNYDLQGNINGHNLVTSVFKYTVTSSDPTNVPAASDRTVASSSNITDSYINTTGSAVLITYTVTPFSSSNNCQGSDFTYKVTVNPEPVGSNDVASICSKGTLNYDLQGNINGHNLVTSVFKYTVTSSDPTNVPAASDRTVASSSNITDSYINTTGSAVLITYTVTPFSSSNNCQGSDFTYKVTVNPEPVGSNDVASICSKGTLNYDLQGNINGHNLVTSVFKYTVTSSDPTNVPAASDRTVASSSNITDSYINTTGSAVLITYTVTPFSSSNNCQGSDFTYKVTVNPEPVGSNDVASICSKGTLNYDLQGNINGHNLVTSVFKYTVTSSDPTNVPAASDRTVASSSNITDSYINTTGSAVLITYTVTPFSSSNNCQGSDFTYKVTVNPEPVGSNDVASICSKGTLNYDLQGNINGHNLVISVFKYTVTSSDPTHVPAASDRTVASSSNITDSYINTTGSAVLITYTVTPFSSSNSCQGSDFTYTVTVNPEPVLSNLNKTICSDVQTGITLGDGYGLSDRFEIVSILPQTGLVAGSIHSTTGPLQLSDAISSDTWTNKTAGALTVTYAIIPRINSGCIGDQKNVVVTINPEPDLVTPAPTICSNAVTGITLTDVHGLANSFEIVSITPTGTTTPGAGNSSVGTGKLASAITSDIWTNLTTVTQTVTYAIIPRIGGGCIGDKENIVVTINPITTLTNASQLATVCDNSTATINLMGLLPNSIFNLSYAIDGVDKTAINDLTADGSGFSSFTTPLLAAGLNGKILRVKGINVTNETPNCALTFTTDAVLRVDLATVPGTVSSAQSICSGTSPADLTLSGYTGSVVKWQKSTDGFSSNSTDILVASPTLDGATIGNLNVNTSFRAVVQSGVCSPSNSAPVLITVNTRPTPSITGAAGVNVNSTGIIYNTEASQSSYIWSVSGAGNSITSGTGTNSITVTFNTPGDQTVSVNYNDSHNCSATTPYSKPVHVNARPVASNITILGDPRSNITLNTFYSFLDAETDLEGTSTFQWYTGTDASGAGSTPITLATTRTYKVKDADSTKYIGFSVIPVAQSGATPGVLATSAVWVGPVTNAAPTASSVAISGSKNVTGVLTGHYTYSDLENDLESGTLFQWYSSASLAGPYTPIASEIYNTHVIANEEQGLYFQFHVTPKAATGKSTGYEVISAGYGPANSQPYADNVTLTGSLTIGSVLTGSYSYHDVDNDVQGTTTFRWLRTNTGGTSAISGATGLTYTLTSTDEGYVISFEVIPVALTGYPTNGSVVTALTSGPVLDPSVLVPLADQVCISGIRKTGEVLTAKYNYTFYKSEGTSGYRWLLNNSAIPGATSIQYIITQADMDSGQDIVFEVTPKSSNFIPKVGSAVKSTPLARIKLAQTNYSLADTAFVLVPNVSGGVFSGQGVSNGWFSPWNADTALKPPHTIKYDLTITNSVTTCSEQATVNITVVPVNAYFVGLKGNYCYDDKPDTIFVKNVPLAATNRTYVSSNPASIVKIMNQDTIIIDPRKKRPGITKDTLFYNYVFNGSYFPISQTYTTDSVGVAKISNLYDGQIFCNNEAAFQMYPSLTGSNGITTFTGPVTQTVSGYDLDPKKGLGNTSVSFKFTHPNTGCFSAIVVPISINPAPKVDFSVEKVCVINTSSDAIKFTNKTVSSDPISTWKWEFFEAGSSTSTGSKDASKLFTLGGDHLIRLTATTSNINGKSCSVTKDSTIGIGFKPVANFRWKNDCYHTGDQIQFFDSTTSTVPIKDRIWQFSSSPSDTIQNKTIVKYPMKNSGVMIVTYKVTTNYENCYDVITKNVNIRPVFKLTSAQDYFENFEKGRQGWFKELEVTNNTWTFGKPNNGIMTTAASGDSAWYTGFTDRKIKESSWVNSPCFDFTDTTSVKRPILSLKLFRRFERNMDGGKIQYTIGDIGKWQAVGTVDDGINWYNAALIDGIPGGDGLGWTDTAATWVESRHKLDDLIGKKDVKFRISYGSSGLGKYNDGFAFDDIRIGQRTRKVLLEHFTNSASKDGSKATTLINDLATDGVKDIINIQYHSNFPGTDKFYTDNPGDVSSRMLFYGLSRIPYSFVDGGTNSVVWAKSYNHLPVASLDSIDLIKRSLVNPKFSITLNSAISSGGIITVSGQIKALDTLNARNVTLYLFVTEKQDSTTQTGALGEKKFNNIFRKSIPDAAGITLKTSWAVNDAYTLTDKSWPIPSVIPKAANIEVIAFIQNNVTKEVYQAESIVKQNIVTGIDNVYAGKGFGFGLYPNPASDKLTIVFEKLTDPKTEIMIYDYKGSVLKTYKTGSGLSEFTINDIGLQDGIYLVRVKSGGLNLGYKKLIISRN